MAVVWRSAARSAPPAGARRMRGALRCAGSSVRAVTPAERPGPTLACRRPDRATRPEERGRAGQGAFPLGSDARGRLNLPRRCCGKGLMPRAACQGPALASFAWAWLLAAGRWACREPHAISVPYRDLWHCATIRCKLLAHLGNPDLCPPLNHSCRTRCRPRWRSAPSRGPQQAPPSWMPRPPQRPWPPSLPPWTSPARPWPLRPCAPTAPTGITSWPGAVRQAGRRSRLPRTPSPPTWPRWPSPTPAAPSHAAWPR